MFIEEQCTISKTDEANNFSSGNVIIVTCNFGEVGEGQTSRVLCFNFGAAFL